MKKSSAFVSLCLAVLLIFAGCAVQPEENGEPLDFSPALTFANELFAQKMEAAGVSSYEIDASTAKCRSGDAATFGVEFEYTADGDIGQYCYLISVEDGICSLLEEGESIAWPPGVGMG